VGCQVSQTKVDAEPALSLHLPSVAHKIYGIPQTINTANYVYFLAYKELFALRDQSDPNERLDEIVNGVYILGIPVKDH
jgi:hypothetical protein